MSTGVNSEKQNTMSDHVRRFLYPKTTTPTSVYILNFDKKTSRGPVVPKKVGECLMDVIIRRSSEEMRRVPRACL